jgi:hypothetical protein
MLGGDAFYQEIENAVEAATEVQERPAHSAHDEIRADVAGRTEADEQKGAVGEEERDLGRSISLNGTTVRICSFRNPGPTKHSSEQKADEAAQGRCTPHQEACAPQSVFTAPSPSRPPHAHSSEDRPNDHPDQDPGTGFRKRLRPVGRKCNLEHKGPDQ